MALRFSMGARDQTQVFMFTLQALYILSHLPTPPSTSRDSEPHRLGGKWEVCFTFSFKVRQGQDQGELYRQIRALFLDFREDFQNGDISLTQMMMVLPYPVSAFHMDTRSSSIKHVNTQ